MFPKFSGATGTLFTSKVSNVVSPGVISIFTAEIRVGGDSVIRAGYSMDNTRLGFPASSGGSILIASHMFRIGGEISANG